jgi:hypothetical protein
MANSDSANSSLSFVFLSIVKGTEGLQIAVLILTVGPPRLNVIDLKPPG